MQPARTSSADPSLDPEFDSSDPYFRTAQTFPRLSAEMAARVAGYGSEERLPRNTLVFERGQRSVDFFLVLEGSIEIFDVDVCGTADAFVVLGERQFTGELTLFNDRQVLVSGRTSTESRFVRITPAGFRRLLTG
ncbi:MAG: cyclic nucleotide-binding domain-containing protein, partial [Hyphomicrobiales bacterium]